MCSRQLQTASSRGCVSSAPAGLNRDEDAGRLHGTKKGSFHEIFNLTESERPLAGVCAQSLWPALALWRLRLRWGRWPGQALGAREGSGQQAGVAGCAPRAPVSSAVDG